MNAPALARHFLPESASVSGSLLYIGYEIADGLYVDLYGQAPDADDDCYLVEDVALCGTRTALTGLISGDKLTLLGLWLDTKDNACAAPTAAKFRHEIATLD